VDLGADDELVGAGDDAQQRRVRVGVGEVHGEVAAGEPDAAREGLRDRRRARRPRRQPRGVARRAAENAEIGAVDVGRAAGAPLDTEPAGEGLVGLDDLGLDGDLLQLAPGDVLLEALLLGLLDLVRGHDDDDVALRLGPQLLDVEDRLQGLVPGDLVELHRHGSLYVLAGHDVEAAHLGDEAEDAPDVGILEIGRDLLSRVDLRFLLLDLVLPGLRRGAHRLDLAHFVLHRLAAGQADGVHVDDQPVPLLAHEVGDGVPQGDPEGGDGPLARLHLFAGDPLDDIEAPLGGLPLQLVGHHHPVEGDHERPGRFARGRVAHEPGGRDDDLLLVRRLVEGDLLDIAEGGGRIGRCPGFGGRLRRRVGSGVHRCAAGNQHHTE